MASNDGSVVKEAMTLLDKLSEGKQCLDDFIEDAAKDLQVGEVRSVSVLCFHVTPIQITFFSPLFWLQVLFHISYLFIDKYF